MNWVRVVFLGLAMAICPGRAPAEAEAALTLGIVLGKSSHYGVAASVLADEITRRSGGRFQVEIFAGGILGGERDLVAGLQIGTVDLVIASTGPVGGFVPATLIIDIPFLFRDYGHARAVLDGPIGQEILAEFPKHGLIALAWGENGFRHITTTDRPVTRPADLRGLKLRTMQNSVHTRAFTVLGARPMPMPAPNVYAALQSHVVDGQENPVPVVVDLKLNEVQHYLSLTGHAYSPAVMLVAPRLWTGLGDSDRALFGDAARAAAAAMRAAVDRQEAEGLKALRKAGMTVIDDIDKAAFRAALTPAYADYAREFGQERIDSIRNARP
ncbi:MAG: TRAP transporter substrate-binding protein DctP [Rhodospirillaceae bacterium]